jgi:hypothetical protein
MLSLLPAELPALALLFNPVSEPVEVRQRMKGPSQGAAGALKDQDGDSGIWPEVYASRAGSQGKISKASAGRM